MTWKLVVVLTTTLLWAQPAIAFTYESPFSEGCHELLAANALRNARLSYPAAVPLDATHLDELVIEDLLFSLPSDLNDIAAASLLMGVRDPDIRGRHGLDSRELAMVHGDPENQAAHCLRRPEQDEPDGSLLALEECRQTIRSMAILAMDEGLSLDGFPDGDARVPLKVHLDFAGSVTPELPAFYVYAGQALHTLQDSFTHALRTADGLQIHTILNWIEFAEERLQEDQDGPAHLGHLDTCKKLDTTGQRRLDMAQEASNGLLAIMLDLDQGRNEKLDSLDALLYTYMSYSPGCTSQNAWCNAPELSQHDSLGCTLAPGKHRSSGFFLLFLLGILWRRKSARAIHRFSLISIILLLTGSVARGEPTGSPTPTSAQKTEAPSEPSSRGEFGVYLGAGGSVDRSAIAGSLGGRYAPNHLWLVGLDVEWNPWISLDTGRLRPGTFNIYGSVVRRWPISSRVTLRTTGHLGAAILLFDLYGAQEGSVGPYLGLSLLGLEYHPASTWALVIEPADVVMSVPHVTGAPLTYRQYRFTVGIQFGGLIF